MPIETSYSPHTPNIGRGPVFHGQVTVAAIAIIFNTLTEYSFIKRTFALKINEKIYVHFVKSLACDFIFIASSLCIVTILCAVPDTDIPFIRSPFEFLTKRDLINGATVFLTISSFSAFFDISRSMFAVIQIYYEKAKDDYIK